MELEFGGGVQGSIMKAEGYVTPFEKNLQIWKQLWRVVERSDVLVQIVDARNPLLYRSKDLETYVHQVSPSKETVLLINKADYLTLAQRQAWAKYFDSEKVNFVFFSAKLSHDLLEKQDREKMHQLQAMSDLAKKRDDLGVLSSELAAEQSLEKGPTGADGDREHLLVGVAAEGVGGDDDMSGGSFDSGAEEALEPIDLAAAKTSKKLLEKHRDRSSAHRGLRSKLTSLELKRAVLMGDSSDSEAEHSSEDAAQGTTRSNDPADDLEDEEEKLREMQEEEDEAQALYQSLYEEEQRLSALAAASQSSASSDIVDPPCSTFDLVDKCRILSREELLDFFNEAFKHVPRGSLYSLNAQSQKRKEEYIRRLKDEAVSARREELRRRKEMAERLVEVGLGAQIRYGDQADTFGFEIDPSNLSLDEEAIENAAEAAILASIEEQEKNVPLTIGMVGYPNVGKSSTINVLLGATSVNHASKRVAVASTPGKTKHFQSMKLSDEITLCDCPGLVFPSFLSSREEMVVNGILPIDSMKEYINPSRLVCQRIPRAVLEETYGFQLPKPALGQHPKRQPTPVELLDSLAALRGFTASSHSGFDRPRTARILLKDYCDGKLLFCHPPPTGWLQTSSSLSATRATSAAATFQVQNVLLASAVNRYSSGAPVGHSFASSSVGHLGQVQEEYEEESVEEDEAEDGSEELDEETLRQFSRVVVLDEHPRANENSPEDSSEAAPLSLGEPKPARQARVRGIGRHGKLKKGARPSDPYGTQAAADSANRKYEQTEIEAVSRGFVRTEGPEATSVTDVRLLASSANVSTKSAAVNIRDPVPTHLRRS
jgi:ribosome biogenesis GTPase A